MNEGYFHFLIASLIMGGYLIYTGLKRHRRLRHVEDSPCSKIASAPQGFAEFQGFAWPKRGSHKTLSGQDCVYYQLSLEREETRGTGKSRRKVWVKVFGFSFVKPFYLLDPTGLVEVISYNAECEFKTATARAWSNLPGLEKDNLNKIVSGVSGFPPSAGFLGLFSSKYRVIENFVPVGSPAYVSGNFSSDQQHPISVLDGSLSSFARKVLNVQGRGLKNVDSLLDKNKDGQVNEVESRDGYTTAARVALLNPDIQPTEAKVFGKIDTSTDHKLFLADAHEDHLKERLSNGIWLRLVGGAVSVAVGAVMAVNLFAPRAVRDWNIERNLASLPEENMDTHKLHSSCIGGIANSCAELLHKKDVLVLSPEHIVFYKKRACELGLKEHCQ